MELTFTTLALSFLVGAIAAFPAYALAWRVRVHVLAGAERLCRRAGLPLLVTAALILFAVRYAAPGGTLALPTVMVLSAPVWVSMEGLGLARCEWHHVLAGMTILGVLVSEGLGEGIGPY